MNTTPAAHSPRALDDNASLGGDDCPERGVHRRIARLQRSYAVRGTDLMGLTPEMLGAQALRANEVLKRFGGQWMLH